MNCSRTILATWVLIGTMAVAGAGNEPAQQTLWQGESHGYHTYRIPALVVTSKGVLLAFCEGRKDSDKDSGDIDVLMRRSEDGGRSWSEQQVIWDDGDNTCGNPCPVLDAATGTVRLLGT